MATTTLGKIRPKNIGKLPVVILPLEEYERMKEDLEALRSKRYLRRIEKAREEIRQGRAIPFAEVKRRLKIP
jgi:PHD/YefM family antitoxin component YafN of YafNO toxin-antitoxin module